ncbi:Hypothetical_protein [Hexamita inflata]|uniref:Hypothetical_protein n=1 Tax=Hexamita inflata TaxID=28002 RepID=A0AA86N5M2_9EUKA|nr:Hypothetical protein HINF_LOCUS649 [Hexamita inflata]
MNIISKSECQLTVNSKLNILTASSTNANITNLLVNLSVASSSGNITLINNINGVINIQGYQVLGSYVSTKTVAMIGININAAATINQFSFKPSTFNVGNGSSYLFANASASSFIINNIAIILGNSFNYLLLSSISTTDADNNYYYFGGIIAFININSVVSINNVILDSFQQLTTSYVCKSGFLVGFVQSNTNSITIKNICLQQNTTSTTYQFYNFGLIGQSSGNISIQNAFVIFSTQTTAFFCYYGIIGIQKSSSLYTEVINFSTSVSFSSSAGNQVGSIIGSDEANNCFVQNTSVVGGNITSYSSSFIGGFIGSQSQYTTLKIQNSTIQKMIISGSTAVGSFLGYCYKSQLSLVNSIVQFVQLSGSDLIGIVVGLNSGGIYSFTGSQSTSNFINDVSYKNCAVLSNTWSVAGC